MAAPRTGLLQPVCWVVLARWCWCVLVLVLHALSILYLCWFPPHWGLLPTCPSITASSSLQTAPAPMSPAPPTDSDAPLSQQPAGEDLAKRPLPTEEAALPEEAGDSAGNHHSPTSTSSPTNGDQVQASSVVQPGTSA